MRLELVVAGREEVTVVRVFLADLAYDTLSPNYCIPLNAGYLAAAVDARFQGKFEVSIFKSPTKLEEAIRSEAPDVLGLSNYSWNERLDTVFLEMLKSVKPEAMTVMGGPNIRLDEAGIESFLSNLQPLDYYIVHEGEEAFCNLLEMKYLRSDENSLPLGVATVVDNQIQYRAAEVSTKREMTTPSPYLGGFLDEFLEDPDMIPLFETNRGCPFGCTFCAWGISALNKVRFRDLDTVYAELDYMAKKSVGQVAWMCADANFGINQRDVDIARHIRGIMDQFGYPIKVSLWLSKNTTQRNVEIGTIVNDQHALVALQSTDEDVLMSAGRGRIRLNNLKAQVGQFRERGLELKTDLLVGLPGDTLETHMKTLEDCFELAFDYIGVSHIRLLPGSEYETDQQREEYGLGTKFRPIFGSIGVYRGRPVFEIEESVKSTNAMPEEEFEILRILHWLVYFCWNCGIFRPILNALLVNGINPLEALRELQSSNNPDLVALFQDMKMQSLAEWFDSREEMIQHYEMPGEVETLQSEFGNLNSLWIAEVFLSDKIELIRDELVRIVEHRLISENGNVVPGWEEILEINDRKICGDLVGDPSCEVRVFSGVAAAAALNRPGLESTESVEITFDRSEKDVEFCRYYLMVDGENDFSPHNFARFLDVGGIYLLTHRLSVGSPVELTVGSPVELISSRTGSAPAS